VRVVGLQDFGDVVEHPELAAAGERAEGLAVRQPVLVGGDGATRPGAVDEGLEGVFLRVVQRAGDPVHWRHRAEQVLVQRVEPLRQRLGLVVQAGQQVLWVE